MAAATASAAKEETATGTGTRQGAGSPLPEQWASEADFLASVGYSGGFAPNYPWQPLRCATSLKAPYSSLVAFLAAGHRYDNASLGVAVSRANEHFKEKRLSECVEMCAIAYEIARLHFDYRPLLFDLVVRRVHCLSMLGQVEQAVEEAKLADQIVPRMAVCQLLHALLSFKMGDDDGAFARLQQADELDEDSRDFVQCVVALFRLHRGKSDEAVEICSKVLARRSFDPFALLVRRDAYAASGKQKLAKEDRAALLAAEPKPQLPSEPTQLDQVIFHYHPYLSVQGPRPYEEYPMYRAYMKRQHFMVSCWVVFFVTRLKVSRRSRAVSTNIIRKTEELLTQREHTEKKLWNLLGSYKTLNSVESSRTEVWGPANPDAASRKYRRYWMERPLSFPMRKDGTGVSRAQTGCEDPFAPVISPRSGLADGAGLTIRPEDVPQTKQANWAVEQARLLAEAKCAGSPDGARTLDSPKQLGRESPRSPTRRTSPRRTSPRRTSPTRGGAARQDRQGKAGSQTPTTSSTTFGRPGSAASERSLSPTRTQPKEDPAYLPPGPPPVPYKRLGTDWSEEQWSLKALEWAEQNGGGGSFQRAYLPEPKRAPPPASGEILSHIVSCEDPKKAKLTTAVSSGGWGMPDWYPNLDKIFEVTDMVGRRSREEPLIAKGGSAPAAEGQRHTVTSPPKLRTGRRSTTPRLSVLRTSALLSSSLKTDSCLAASAPAPATAAAVEAASASSRVTPGVELPECPGPAPAAPSSSSSSTRGRSRSSQQQQPRSTVAMAITPKEKLHDWHRQEVLRRKEEDAALSATKEDEATKRQKRDRWEAHRLKQKSKLAQWYGSQPAEEAKKARSQHGSRPGSAKRASSRPSSAGSASGLPRTA